jgi:tetratricopeptide (TPR) repeat protein
LQVFKAHYPAFEPQEEALFYGIYAAVQGNTLVLELLAKNLHNYNNKLKKNYLLSDLRRDLEQGLLQLSKTSAVDVRYQAQGTGLRHEKIEVIIAAMYDLGELSAAETQALSIFAILPAESIPFERLEALSLGLPHLDTTLLALAQKGWLDYNEAAVAFKCSPVIQEVVRVKNENLLEDCRGLVTALIVKLKYEGDIGHLLNATYPEAVLWARWATAIVNLPWDVDNSISILCECLGYYHKTIGSLNQALTFFETQNWLCHKLYTTYPENVGFKNGLAISYSKLGEIHSDLGNLGIALTFFKQFNDLEKELQGTFPQNVEFKSGLAVSYSKLGNTHRNLGDLPLALNYYKLYKNLNEELLDSHVENVKYKNGLAISYSNLGDTYNDLGDLKMALTFFEIQKKLSEELYNFDSKNVNFKRGLAVSYSKLGSTHSALGNLPQALTFFEQFTKLVKDLLETYPENVFFNKHLAIA